MMFRIAVLLSLLSSLSPCVNAQAEAWLEVCTPNFCIVSNAGEKEARRAARRIEGMRAVFQRVFPEAQLGTAAPMLVIAVQDKRSLQALEPESYVGKGQLSLAGLFLPALEKNYVLILLNAPGAHPYAPIYHEYAHFVFTRIHDWMPLWLTEGIAEFYQNAEILDDRVRIGKGDPYIQGVLEHNPLLPLPTLFTVDHHSPYYHEQDKGSIFYAESWALTHFLKDKDDLEGTRRIDDYLDALQKNVDPVEAATQSFGDLGLLQQDLRKYILTGSYALSEISGSTDDDDSTFVVQTLSQIQIDTIRADFLAHDGRENDARLLLQGILREDSSNATARELLGYAAYMEQNFEESRKWCQEAIKLDGQSFFAHYWFAAASLRKGSLDKASRQAVEESLRAAIRLNPSFPFSYDALAMLYAQSGTNLAEARELIQTSIQLAPGVPEIRVDQAQVLASMHQNKEAIDVLELALKMAHTPEQTATLETVLQTVRKLHAEGGKNQRQNATVVSTRASSPGVSVSSATPAETPPHAIYSPDVEYTEEARQAKLQGTCVVSLLVGIDGKPGNVVVVKKLGMGMDEKAVETVRRWRFDPGTRNGRPVISRLTLSLKFQLVGTDTERYFRLAEKARTGDPAAEFELAKAFLEGRELPKDEKQGMALLERAARSGLPEAQFQMAERIYGDGNNAETYVDAYVWYALAQRGAAVRADARVSELEARMTRDQLSEARKRLEDSLATSK